MATSMLRNTNIQKRIQKFDSNGTYLAQLGSEGSGDGQFSVPSFITADSNDHIYVVDSQNHRIQKFDSNGTYLAQWGSEGSGDGQFAGTVNGIAIGSDDNIYVADETNDRIQVFGYPTNTNDVAPLILVPDDITVDATSTYGTQVDYIVKAIDAQDEILTPTCILTSASIFPAGPNVVTCSVTDSDDNTTTRTFGVTVGISIDDWVKQVAGFWCNDEITDASFVSSCRIFHNTWMW